MEGTSSNVIRILIADDHALVREGLRALFDLQPDMRLVGEAEDGHEVVRQALRLQPDVILLDLVMPGQDGHAAIAEILRHNPQAHILVLTSFGADENVVRAIRAGAAGYSLKNGSPGDLLEAIRDVARGKSSLRASLAVNAIRHLDTPPTPAHHHLTEREVDVLKRVAGGYSNRQIADDLAISERTVGSHVSHLLEKLHMENRTQLALYALRTGLASLGDDSSGDAPHV